MSDLKERQSNDIDPGDLPDEGDADEKRPGFGRLMAGALVGTVFMAGALAGLSLMAPQPQVETSVVVDQQVVEAPAPDEAPSEESIEVAPEVIAQATPEPAEEAASPQPQESGGADPSAADPVVEATEAPAETPAETLAETLAATAPDIAPTPEPAPRGDEGDAPVIADTPEPVETNPTVPVAGETPEPEQAEAVADAATETAEEADATAPADEAVETVVEAATTQTDPTESAEGAVATVEPIDQTVTTVENVDEAVAEAPAAVEAATQEPAAIEAVEDTAPTVEVAEEMAPAVEAVEESVVAIEDTVAPLEAPESDPVAPADEVAEDAATPDPADPPAEDAQVETDTADAASIETADSDSVETVTSPDEPAVEAPSADDIAAQGGDMAADGDLTVAEIAPDDVASVDAAAGNGDGDEAGEAPRVKDADAPEPADTQATDDAAIAGDVTEDATQGAADGVVESEVDAPAVAENGVEEQAVPEVETLAVLPTPDATDEGAVAEPEVASPDIVPEESAPEPDVSEPDVVEVPEEVAVVTPAAPAAAPAATSPVTPQTVLPAGPAWEVNAVAFETPADTPLIGVILELGRSSVEGYVDPMAVFSTGLPLNIAIVPSSPEVASLAAAARAAGLEVIAHLPMEPKGAADPGPEAIRVEMSGEAIAELTRRLVARLPQAVAASNFMGSRATEDREVMAAVIGALNGGGFGFVDTRTSVRSRAVAVAADLGGPHAKNSRFIPEDVTAQDAYRLMERAAFDARQQNGAVVIGPASREMLLGLQRWALERNGKRARLAPITALMRAEQGR